jgi:hypothetical protein
MVRVVEVVLKVALLVQKQRYELSPDYDVRNTH